MMEWCPNTHITVFSNVLYVADKEDIDIPGFEPVCNLDPVTVVP